MIISHEHKFIFLKTRKTASGACEVALGEQCGPNDIIYPDTDTIEASSGRVVEQNNIRTVPSIRIFLRRLHRGYPKHGVSILPKAVRDARRYISSFHADARYIRSVVGEKVWNEYYTFCFERNPFDRLVSFYHWRTKDLQHKPSFKQFAHAVVEGDQQQLVAYNARNFSNRPFYEIDGKLSVDRVCLFEDLENELQDVAGRLGIECEGGLIHTKDQANAKRKHYREYYDEELQKICSEAFSHEMNMFGYEF